jgi:hypothetical protein
MRLPVCLRLTGCVLLGLLFLCPSRVCGQTISSTQSSIAKTFSLSIPLAERHAFVVSTEYMRVESLPKPFAEQLYVKPAWRYKGVPLTLGYAYALTNPDNRIVPVVGVGVSCYFGSAKQLASYSHEPAMLHSGEEPASSPRLLFDERLGVGYGAEATLGLRADLNRSLFVLAQGRARYIHGLAFTSNDYDFHTAFAKIDFAIGFGFKF